MNFKNTYSYLFYKFYKFAKWTPSIYPSDFGAVTLLVTLELGILFSINNYLEIYLNHNSNDIFFSLKTFIIIFLIIYTKWHVFWRNSAWREYVKEFDQWPKDRNMRGTWLVLVIVILICANFIFSCILSSPYRLN